MGKYDPLRDYLVGLAGDEEPMTFGQVERLVGPLPESAREHRAWWGNDSYQSQSIAWQAAGWHVASVDQASGHVVFARGVKGGTPATRQRAQSVVGSYVDAQVIAPITAQQGTDKFDRSPVGLPFAMMVEAAGADGGPWESLQALSPVILIRRCPGSFRWATWCNCWRCVVLEG